MALASVIQAIGMYVPERVVTNDELSTLMDTSDQWITERTGIKQRRFVKEGQTTSDIALSACEDLVRKNPDINLKDVDCIVAATLSPDYYFPGIGTFLQHSLGLEHIPAFDIRQQCSGFVYGLSVIDGLIQSQQYKKILLVCAEVQSPVLELNDNGRDMAVLFGDGAGAILVEAEATDIRPLASNSQRGIIASKLGSDGSGADLLCLKAPGTATPGFLSEEAFRSGQWHPYMDGRAVFKNAVTRLTEVAAQILRENSVSSEELAMVVPHQANLRINEMVREKLNLPEEKVFNNIQRYGNTTAATIPLLLAEADEQNLIKRGDLIMSVAFGAGFTWGANLFRW